MQFVGILCTPVLLVLLMSLSFIQSIILYHTLRLTHSEHQILYSSDRPNHHIDYSVLDKIMYYLLILLFQQYII